MKLVNYMAKSCYYAQEHIDDLDAWPEDVTERGDLLQCTSFQMACFLAQNTINGNEGVDWEIVWDELVQHPMKSEKEWKKILNNIAKELGGWKKKA